jgi:hypothetical protein
MKLRWSRNEATAGWSAIWALALIAAAFLFKRSVAFYWVTVPIFVAAVTQILWRTERQGKRC